MANNNHFELTLDTLAPSGSITRPAQYVNAQTTLTIDKGDASFMYVWFDTKPQGDAADKTNLIEAADSYVSTFSTDGVYYYHLILLDTVGNESAVYNTESITYDVQIPVIGETKITKRDGTETEVITTREAGVALTFSDNLSGCVSYDLYGDLGGDAVVIPSATAYAANTAISAGSYVAYNYAAYVATENITAEENTSFEAISAKLSRDDAKAVDYAASVAYSVGQIILNSSKTYRVTTAITAIENTSFEAISSKVEFFMHLTGAISAEEREAGAKFIEITLSGDGEEEATKKIYSFVTDAATNISAPDDDTIYLDTAFLVGNIILRDAADENTITATWVNTADFNIALDASEKSDWKGYRVWGDFNADGSATGTTKPETFTDLTEAEKTAKRVLLARKFTSGDFGSDDTSKSLAEQGKCVYAEIVDESDNVTLLTGVFAKVDYTAPTKDGTASTTPEIACDVTYVSDKVWLKKTNNPDMYVPKSEVASKYSDWTLQQDFTVATFTPTANYDISGAATYQWYVNGDAFPQAKGGSGIGPAVALTVNSADLAPMTEEEKTAGKAARVFTLTVVDNAGNTVTTEGVTLYLDTVAPKCNSIAMDAWYNGDAAETDTYQHFSTAGATASATEAGAGNASFRAWCSQTADDTSIPAARTSVTYKENPAHGDIDWTGHAESSTNYIHIEYVDNVGNAMIYHSSSFGIDTERPDNGSVAFTKEAYPSTSAIVNLSYSDSTSGVSYFKIWGDITEAATQSAAEWQAIANAKALTLSGEDGEKTVNVLYKDLAGNVSQTAVTDSTELDTSKPTTTLLLRELHNTADKPAHSNLATFSSQITKSDDATGKVFYTLYGDFTSGSTQAAEGISYVNCVLYRHTINYTTGVAYMVGEFIKNGESIYKVTTAITAAENTSFDAISTKVALATTAYAKDELVLHDGVIYKATSDVTTAENTGWDAVSSKFTADTDHWKELVYDSGKAYKLVDDLICTLNDGTKNVNVKIMDNAGNQSDVVTQSFDFDTTVPEVTITGPDYDRISLVNALRKKVESGTVVDITGKYADQVNFSFSPNGSMYQAYKVCAYKDAAATDAGNSGSETKKYSECTTIAEKNTWVGLQVAIPTTAGSTHMAETGLNQSTSVDSMIKGADYQDALGTKAVAYAANTAYEAGTILKNAGAYYTVTTAITAEENKKWDDIKAKVTGNAMDGAHFVVVYVQDLAGNWSVAASFTARFTR